MSNKELDEKLKIVTSAQISKILGFTTARIRQLENDGALVKISHGKFDLAASIQRYVEYIREQEISDEELDLNRERTLLTRANREKVELELQIMRGELHRSDDVKRVMNDMLSAFRARCISIPSKAAPRLISQTEIPVIQDIIKKEVYEALAELSEYDSHRFYSQSKDKLVISASEESEQNEQKLKRRSKRGKNK